MLQGSLDNFTLDEVLGLLAGTEKTGRLRVSGDRGTGSVWLDDGELVGGSISTADEEDAEDVIFEMMRFNSGNFSFIMDEEPPNPCAPVGVDTVVASAGRRLGEWREIEAVVPTLAHRVDLNPMPESVEIAMSRNEWQAVIAVGNGSSVGTVCTSLELGEVDGSRMLKGMVERGLILVAAPDPAAPLATNTGPAANTGPANSAEADVPLAPLGEMAGMGASFLSDEAPSQGSFVDSLAAHTDPMPAAGQPDTSLSETSSSFEPASFEAGSFEAGSFEAGSFEAGSFEPAESGPFESAPLEAGSFEAGSFEAGSFEAAQSEAAPAFEAAAFEAAAFEAAPAAPFGSASSEQSLSEAGFFAEPASDESAPIAPSAMAPARKGGLSFDRPVRDEPLDLAQLYAFSGEDTVSPGGASSPSSDAADNNDELPRSQRQVPPPPPSAAMPLASSAHPFGAELGDAGNAFQRTPPPSPTFDFGGPGDGELSAPTPPPPPPPSMFSGPAPGNDSGASTGFPSVPMPNDEVPVSSPQFADAAEDDEQEEASMLMRYLKSEH